MFKSLMATVAVEYLLNSDYTVHHYGNNVLVIL